MNGVFSVECRWLGRAFSAVILLFVGAHVVSGGVPDVASAPPGERVLFAWFGLALLGLGLLWRWEAVGASLSVAAALGFYLTEFYLSGKLPSGWFLAMFFLPGGLTLASLWFRYRRPAT